MVAGAEDYPWSSAAAHCGVHSDPLLFALPEPRPTSVTDWSKWPAVKDDEKMLATLRLNTRTGRPAGGKRIILELESRLGRRMGAMPVGRLPNRRPKKW